MTDVILEQAKAFIPKKTLREHKSTHPWVNDQILNLVAARKQAEGTAYEKLRRNECSAGILAEYIKYIEKERKELRELPRGVRRWWTKARRLMQKKKEERCVLQHSRFAQCGWSMAP